MGKKILIIISIIIILVLCAIWAPWKEWDTSITGLLGLTPPEKFAKLQVTSISGEIKIFVDGEERGSVGPEGSPFLIEDVKPGQRLIRIVKVSDNPDSYISFERYIRFNEDISTVIAYELGPTHKFSTGHVISAYKSYANKNETKLNITTEPEEVEIFLDEKNIGESPIETYPIDISKTHTITFSKKGYEKMKINLLPQEPEAREKLKGYDILVEANLFLIPIKIEEK